MSNNDSNQDKTGPEAAVDGVVEGVKGKAKEIFGAITNDKEKVQEGQAQQDKADSLKDAAKAEAQAETSKAEAESNEQRQKQAQNS